MFFDDQSRRCRNRFDPPVGADGDVEPFSRVSLPLDRRHPTLRLQHHQRRPLALPARRLEVLHPEANQADRTSTLQLYRSALRLRRTGPNLRSEEFRWLDSPADKLLFARGNGLLRAVNLSDQPIPLPDATSPLLVSGPLSDDGMLPPDITVLAAPGLTDGCRRDHSSWPPRASSGAQIRQGLSGVSLR
ncbi:DUF3459 domain-containing protein [Streptomyces prunicolor]|uniref:DUF3459 domain-containing protein n=1 Tax=Streptomyces prunicolor TaxID=67348 RepID=UPI003722CE55